MNKIQKTYPAPEILTTKGVELTVAALEQVNNGNKKICIDYNTYGHTSVKRQLISDQHNKCAYCEQTLNGDFGDVEHFRPKAGYCSTCMIVKSPGYYWLAYDWDNLMMSCSTCNRRYKRNFFPLLDEASRDIEHRDISKEVPLLINPVKENPGKHICFEQHIIKPRFTDGIKDPIGLTTIETFKLNDRNDLVERRRQRWEEYMAMRKLITVITLHPEVCTAVDAQLVQNAFDQMKDEQAEFTGMFKYQVNE